MKVRRLIRNDFDTAFHEVDVLLGPTSPTPAFKLGERTADSRCTSPTSTRSPRTSPASPA
ncbi:MAG: amidase family protein [Isosphaeraceae bacterium]